MPIDTKETISSQPQATTPMAAGGNRNALNREVGVDGQRDWSFDLFDCTSACDLWCWAAWCPCVVYSKNKQRLQHLQTRGTPLPSGGETIVAFMAACLFPVTLGSCRLVPARTSADATTFVEIPWAIALRLGVAILVRLRRSAVKSTWRRTVLKGFLNPREYLC
ncbi:hypothetical protein EDB83DRAFT_1726778 [Lactarius deliciosus]|nr:hypothetical protein EDB83DRAFT_1726778 [Lactarius deliciosus]